MAEEMEMVLTLKKWQCGTCCYPDPVSTCLKSKKREAESEWQKRWKWCSQMKKLRCGTYCQSDPVSRLKHGMKVAICSKMWFEVESRLNGQRHNPGWIQFRHDRFRITRWRENPYKDRNPKTLI